MGYSIGTGRFFRSNSSARAVEHAVLGAPRVDFVGSVVFFRLDRSTAEQTPEMIEYSLNGAQSGEYFGSTLLVVDINRDGYDDLLVGAPIYSTFRKGFSDEGRVFVYVSNGLVMQLQTNLQ